MISGLWDGDSPQPPLDPQERSLDAAAPGDAPSCSAQRVAPQAQAHPRDAVLGQNAAVSAVAAARAGGVRPGGDGNWSKYPGSLGEVGPLWGGRRGGWDPYRGSVDAGAGSSARLIPAPPTEIREAFKVFDRDGNGFISKQELGTAMRSLGYMPNEVELEVIIQRLDMDGRSPGRGQDGTRSREKTHSSPVFPPHMLDMTRDVR